VGSHLRFEPKQDTARAEFQIYSWGAIKDYICSIMGAVETKTLDACAHSIPESRAGTDLHER
jgi:hypothetical protein